MIELLEYGNMRLQQAEGHTAAVKPFSTQRYEQKVKATIAGEVTFSSPEQLLTQARMAHGRNMSHMFNSADLRQRSVTNQSMVRLQAEMYAKSIPDDLLAPDDDDEEEEKDGNAGAHAHNAPAGQRSAAAMAASSSPGAAPTPAAAAAAAGGSAQRLARLRRASATAVPSPGLKSALKSGGGASRAHAAFDSKPAPHAVIARGGGGTALSDEDGEDDGVPAIVVIHGDSYPSDDDDDTAADEARAAALRQQCAAAPALGPAAASAAPAAADAQQKGRAENLISQLRTFQRGSAGPSYLGGGVEASVRAGSVSLPQGCSFMDQGLMTARPSRLAPTGAASGPVPATPPHLSPVAHRIGDFRSPTSPLSPAASGSAASGVGMNAFLGCLTDPSMRPGRMAGGAAALPVSPSEGSVRPGRGAGGAISGHGSSGGLSEMAARSVRAGAGHAHHHAGGEEGGGQPHRHAGADKSVYGGSPGGAPMPSGTVRVADPGALRRRVGSSASDPSVRPGLGTRLSVTTGSIESEPGLPDVQSPVSPAPTNAVSLFKAITGAEPTGRPLPAEGVEYSGKSVRGGTMMFQQQQGGLYGSAPVGHGHVSSGQVEVSGPSCMEPRGSCPSSMRLPRIGSSLMMGAHVPAVNSKGQYGGPATPPAGATGPLVDSHGEVVAPGMMNKVKGLFGLLKR